MNPGAGARAPRNAYETKTVKQLVEQLRRTHEQAKGKRESDATKRN